MYEKTRISIVFLRRVEKCTFFYLSGGSGHAALGTIFAHNVMDCNVVHQTIQIVTDRLPEIGFSGITRIQPKNGFPFKAS